MAIKKACRVGVLVLGLTIIGGCALFTSPPDPIEVMEAERENLRMYYAVVSEVARPPSGNAGGEAHLAYQVRMAAFQGDVNEVAPRTAEAVFEYQAAVNQMAFNWLNLLVNNPFTNAYAQKLAGGVGGSVKIMADGQSRIENIDMTMGDGSPFVTGNDNVTAVDEGQNQSGDGTQGQVNNKTNDQQDLETEGGPISNAPEGLGFEGSL